MNAAEPNSEIIACGQCGTKNRPKAHEAGKALVCGNCKAPLAQQQQPNTLSNTSMHSDGNGAVYYNRNNWLITQHSISTPEHIIRLSDVQRIEVKWCAPIMNTRDKQILALLAVGGCVVYFLLNGFTLNWPHILYCALPSVIWFGYASENSRGSYDLVAHCTTGPVCLRNSRRKEEQELREIANAIGEALAHFQSTK